MSFSKAKEASPHEDRGTTSSSDDQNDREHQDRVKCDAEVENISGDPKDNACNSSIVDEPSLTLSDGGDEEEEEGEDATPNTAAAVLVGRAVERALGSPKRNPQLKTATTVDENHHNDNDNTHSGRNRSAPTSFVSDPNHSLLSSPRLLSGEGAAVLSAPQNNRNRGDKAIPITSNRPREEASSIGAVANSVVDRPQHHPQEGGGGEEEEKPARPSDASDKEYSSGVDTRRRSSVVIGNSKNNNKVLSMLPPQHNSTTKQQLKNSGARASSSVVREEKRKSEPSSKADVIPERRSGRNKSEGGNSNTSASAAAAATERQQNQILQKILTELKALKAALPTQNEVAMVFAQNPEDGTRLQAYCRGMIRRMQSLERKRKAMSEVGGVEQKRQTIIQKARQRREEQHLVHVAEFLMKEALRVDKREERVEVLTDETAESRMRRQQMLKEAEAKRQEQEAQRAAKLEESVAKWKEHAERVAEEKEKERERANAVRARRIHEEVVNSSDRGSSFLTLPHGIGHSQGSVPAVSSLSTSSGAAYRAALARAQQQQSNQTQCHSHSQSRLDEDDDTTPMLSEDPEAKAMSATGRTSLSHGDNHHSSNAAGASATPPALTREAFEQIQQQERLQREQALAQKMAAHLRRSELVRIHRRETAKKMTERGASIPAFKEKLLESQEEAYRNQLAKENEEKALLEQFQQSKQRIVLERIEKNRKRQEEAQRRVEQQKAAEEERLKALVEKKKLKEQKGTAKTVNNAPSGATDSSAPPNGLSMNGASAHALPSPARSTGGGQASTASSPPRHYQQQQHQLLVEQQAAAARMSKLARKLLERTERVAALYSVEPVAASAPLQETAESPEKNRGASVEGQEADEGQQTASVRRTREDRKREKEEAERAAAEEAARERAQRIEKFLSPTRQHVWERAPPPDRERSEERNGKDSKGSQNTSSPHSKSPAAKTKGGKAQSHAHKAMSPHRQQPMAEPSALSHTQGSAMDANAKRCTSSNHKMNTNMVEKLKYQCELCKDQCDESCMCCNHHHSLSLSEGIVPEAEKLRLPYDALALFFDPSFFTGSAHDKPFPALRLVGEVAGFGLSSSPQEVQPVADGAAEVAEKEDNTEASQTEGVEDQPEEDTTNEGDQLSQNRHPYVAAMYLAAAAK